MSLDLSWKPPPKPISSEVELARAVRSHLAQDGWTVYQEVQVSAYGSRADLVAVNENTVWVIETKCKLSLRLLDQVLRWHHLAHYVSIATLATRCREGVQTFCVKTGIGWLQVSEYGVREIVKPLLDLAATGAVLLHALRPEHQTFAEAGNATSRYFTPYQSTCQTLRAVVEAQPGISLQEAVGQINHHYSSHASARNALGKWLRLGRVEGISSRVEFGRMLLFPGETC